MSDDKTFIGGQDRARVAGEQDYELEHFVAKHGISAQRVRELIERYGNDRETLERQVAKIK